jgi:hypothetical protein
MATESAAEIVCRLPEQCVAHAISLTTLGDACHSSAVSPAPFRPAADSDAAWARFLPPDHADDVLARADERPVAACCASKEDPFSHLCDCSPVLLDGATMALVRNVPVPPVRSIRSGARCFVLSARALSIAWGDDPSCWTWAASPPGSRWVHHECPCCNVLHYLFFLSGSTHVSSCMHASISVHACMRARIPKVLTKHALTYKFA